MDTLLGILAHGGLATALVLLAVWRRRIDLHAYLFGDILAVSWGEGGIDSGGGGVRVRGAGAAMAGAGVADIG